jgi:rhamnosyltransferase
MHSHNYSLREIYGRRFVEGEADAFIHRDHSSATRAAGNTLKSVARDAIDHIRVGDFRGLVKSPARRAVYHWAHFKGHRLGERRRISGDGDGSVGQQTVLERRIR